MSSQLVGKGLLLDGRAEAAHSLQGEALDAADPQLVVGALAGERRHVHEEVLGLGGGAGRRLAQSVGHMLVGVFPLVAGETRKVEERRRGGGGEVGKRGMSGG